jgi:hypothetical protein
MRPAHRFSVYSSQNGGTIDRFTGPQRRRFMKKYRCIEKAMRLERERQELAEVERQEEISALQNNLARKSAEETPAVRPCGGVDYCITRTTGKKTKTHVGCELVVAA